MGATLVFPVTTPDGRAYLKDALARGENVVTASCDARDPTEGVAPWRRLPLVNEPNFVAALQELVRAFDVTRVRTGAHVPHAALAQLIEAGELGGLSIINASALQAEYARWDDIFARAAAWRSVISSLYPAQEAPDEAFIAGVIRLAFSLFGESYDDKLAALMGALNAAPAGDVVEIGALFGRSASVLLAGRDLGAAKRNVFVFDPWSAEDGAQQDLPEGLRAYTRTTNFALIVRAFEATFAAIAPEGSFAAYRAASAVGNAFYRGAAALEEKRLIRACAPAKPAGAIALLHIDGNHDYRWVAEDVALWAPLVARGGWVVIDDYRWRYGDGPRQAGDELLAHWGEAVACAFVIGDCLFAQRAP